MASPPVNTPPTPSSPAAPPTDAAAIRLVLSTAPPDVAARIGRTLVEERLAACVHLVPGLRSVYRWSGAVNDDPETMLVVKTTTERLPALANRLEELHPYEVVELLVLRPEGASPAYAEWLREACAEGVTAPARDAPGPAGGLGAAAREIGLSEETGAVPDSP